MIVHSVDRDKLGTVLAHMWTGPEDKLRLQAAAGGLTVGATIDGAAEVRENGEPVGWLLIGPPAVLRLDMTERAT